ncbi:MAG: winged helix-turn-helix domain-containing protein [Paludibacter sp.]|nr:winged helix-turn-helix domain-containing protein [Paludibacter sp.]
MDQRLIPGMSYVKSSKYRYSIVLLLYGNILTPSEIQQKLNIRLNHVSLHLKELRDMNIVVCLNEDAKKGRLYELSDLGNELYNYINKPTIGNE